MKSIEKREECLAEVLSLDDKLASIEAAGLEAALNNIVERLEIKLKELRSLSIACIELIVLWRD